jgi:hypothetical protein
MKLETPTNETQAQPKGPTGQTTQLANRPAPPNPNDQMDVEVMLHQSLVVHEAEETVLYEELREPARQMLLEILLPPLLQL